jgi:hypothetical protein
MERERERERERELVAYWNGDLVDMCNLDTVKYCFFLWFSLGN